MSHHDPSEEQPLTLAERYLTQPAMDRRMPRALNRLPSPRVETHMHTRKTFALPNRLKNSRERHA